MGHVLSDLKRDSRRGENTPPPYSEHPIVRIPEDEANAVWEELTSTSSTSLWDPPAWVYPWLPDFINTELDLQECVQEEIFKKEERLRVSDSLKIQSVSQQEKSLVNKLDQDLEELNKRYWRLDQTANRLLRSCPSDAFSVVLLQYPKEARWHLATDLRADCAHRGGCCGRACQCCGRPRDTTRQRAYGHCTAACGCCRRHRGFELTAEDRALASPRFEISDASHRLTVYEMNMAMAFICGPNWAHNKYVK